MVALLMERPFWDSDNLPMITLYCENAVMLVLLALGFNVTLTGQCCSGGLSGALLPLMDSIAGATAVGSVGLFWLQLRCGRICCLRKSEALSAKTSSSKEWRANMVRKRDLLQYTDG